MNRFQKIGKAYRMSLDDGTALWIRRDRATHRYDLIWVHRDPQGARAVSVLSTFRSVKAAVKAAQKDADGLLILTA